VILETFVTEKIENKMATWAKMQQFIQKKIIPNNNIQMYKKVDHFWA
jgi:hypothetical protein